MNFSKFSKDVCVIEHSIFALQLFVPTFFFNVLQYESYNTAQISGHQSFSRRVIFPFQILLLFCLMICPCFMFIPYCFRRPLDQVFIYLLGNPSNNNKQTNWQVELDLLLFYYRARPHSSTGVSPMHAMHGWIPRGLVVDGPPQQYNIGSWIADLDIRSARIRQHLDEAYATADFMAEPTSKFSDGVAAYPKLISNQKIVGSCPIVVANCCRVPKPPNFTQLPYSSKPFLHQLQLETKKKECII